MRLSRLGIQVDEYRASINSAQWCTRPHECFRGPDRRALQYPAHESAFASWVGLRGAVPIYLTIIPVLAGSPNAALLFGATFGVVIVSLVLQGWTISPAARVLGFGKMPAKGSGH